MDLNIMNFTGIQSFKVYSSRSTISKFETFNFPVTATGYPDSLTRTMRIQYRIVTGIGLNMKPVVLISVKKPEEASLVTSGIVSAKVNIWSLRIVAPLEPLYKED